MPHLHKALSLFAILSETLSIMKFLQLFLLIILCISSQAQTSNTYQTDLTELQNILRKTPSYKDQIKGQSLISYDSLFEKLLSDTVKNASDYKYFYNLAQLFLLLFNINKLKTIFTNPL